MIGWWGEGYEGEGMEECWWLGGKGTYDDGLWGRQKGARPIEGDAEGGDGGDEGEREGGDEMHGVSILVAVLSDGFRWIWTRMVFWFEA